MDVNPGILTPVLEGGESLVSWPGSFNPLPEKA
jgi:hypothetical protein